MSASESSRLWVESALGSLVRVPGVVGNEHRAHLEYNMGISQETNGSATALRKVSEGSNLRGMLVYFPPCQTRIVSELLLPSTKWASEGVLCCQFFFLAPHFRQMPNRTR